MTLTRSEAIEAEITRLGELVILLGGELAEYKERLASMETGLRAVVLLIEADDTASPLLHRCAGVLKMSVPWSGEE